MHRKFIMSLVFSFERLQEVGRSATVELNDQYFGAASPSSLNMAPNPSPSGLQPRK